jgi:hypothetical protein
MPAETKCFVARVLPGTCGRAKAHSPLEHGMLIAVAAGVISLGQPADAAQDGGRIIGASRTNAQMQLQFLTTAGNSYQVQSSTAGNSRFWSDVLAPLSATGSLGTVLAPASLPIGFFQVLEFTNRTFWYDWGYYYETPFLTNWGLGSAQNGYVHNDRPYEWYIDQADTGVNANANCGPSSVTMALKWYNPSFTNTAAAARALYPEEGGWWYTWDINNYLNLYSVPYTNVWYTGTNQLMQVLSQGSLVILDIDTTYLGADFASEHRAGRFYGYTGGHFIVVKGWRIVDNTLYFEVYDPYNWHLTYGDGSPDGRNRHFRATDLSNAITAWWNYLIVIPQPAWVAQGSK